MVQNHSVFLLYRCIISIIFFLTSAQRMLNCILQRVNSNYTVLYVKW